MTAAVARRRHTPPLKPLRDDPPRARLTVFGLSDLRKWQIAILSSSDLTDGQKIVALALASFHNTFSGRCFPGLDALSKRSCRTKNPVLNAIKALETQGWIRVERSSGGSGKSNEYRLINC